MLEIFVLKWLEQIKYRKQVLRLIEGFTLISPKEIQKMLPNIGQAIDDAYNEKRHQDSLVMQLVSTILTVGIESIGNFDRLQKVKKSLIDWVQEGAFARTEVAIRSKQIPKETDVLLWRLQWAIINALKFLNNGNIDKDCYSHFYHEILGALDGKSAEERRNERLANTIHKTLKLPEIREGEDDIGSLLPCFKKIETSPLLGTSYNVKLVPTATGIALINRDDGKQITVRRSISQEDLAKVPSDATDCTFVNLTLPSGEIHSCIIAGQNTEVYGSMRAFWWFLAKGHVRTISSLISGTRMTPKALAHLHAAARGMWDSAIGQAGSINNMRNLIVPLRNGHLTVVSQLKNQQTSEAERLGLDVALGMILATQSEDPKLEAYAFKYFKQFLWQPGEEPTEFLNNL